MIIETNMFFIEKWCGLTILKERVCFVDVCSKKKNSGKIQAREPLNPSWASKKVIFERKCCYAEPSVFLIMYSPVLYKYKNTHVEA